ncbi:MAG TPA: DinB family protein [Blastocatellia bacterium]
MAEILSDLIQHNSYANSALIQSIGKHEKAARDPELLRLLHHINVANRHWFLIIVNEPFVLEREIQVPETLEQIAAAYREICDREVKWGLRLPPAELERKIESPFIPGVQVSVTEAMLQVCLHSNAHRAQCATRLRELGGSPPMLDFVMWLKDRPLPDWSCAESPNV